MSSSHCAQGYIYKEEIDKFPDLSYTSMRQIQAKNIRNGMWCIHSKSGFTGQVIKYHQVKSGKHGHMKCIYELRYPHNNKIAKESFSAKTHVKEAIVESTQYLISHVDKERTDYKQLNAIKQHAKQIISAYTHSIHKFKMDIHAIPTVIRDLCFEYYFTDAPQQYNIVCFDDELRELTFPVVANNNNSNLIDSITHYQEVVHSTESEFYLQILECPKVSKKKVVMIQIVRTLVSVWTRP